MAHVAHASTMAVLFPALALKLNTVAIACWPPGTRFPSSVLHCTLALLQMHKDEKARRRVQLKASRRAIVAVLPPLPPRHCRRCHCCRNQQCRCTQWHPVNSDLQEEMQRGYFDDFRDFRDSKGKVFFGPEKLIPAAHVSFRGFMRRSWVVHMSRAWQARGQTASGRRAAAADAPAIDPRRLLAGIRLPPPGSCAVGWHPSHLPARSSSGIEQQQRQQRSKQQQQFGSSRTTSSGQPGVRGFPSGCTADAGGLGGAVCAALPGAERRGAVRAGDSGGSGELVPRGLSLVALFGLAWADLAIAERVVSRCRFPLVC